MGFARELPLTERVATALRLRNPEAVRAASPVVGTLMDLLTVLGYRDTRREVLESLPHYEDTLDVTELRKMLLCFGIATDSVRMSIGRVEAERMPCLFIPAGGSLPHVALRREGLQVVLLDPNTGAEMTLPGATRGVVLLLTDQTRTNDAGSQDWCSDLLSRFHGLLKHLLAMSLFTNLVALASPLFLMSIYDYVVGPDSTEPLLGLVMGMALMLAIDLVMRVLKTRTLSLVAGRLEYLIGVQVFARLMTLPQSHTERASPDAQITQLRQFDSIREFMAGSGALALLDAPFLVLYVVAIAWVAGPLVWVPLAAALVLALVALVLLPWVQARSAAASTSRMERQRLFMESLTGLREIKARTAERTMLDRFRIASAACARASAQLQSANALMEVASQLVGTVAAVVVVVYGVEQVLAGELTMGGLVAAVALTWRFLGPIQALTTTVLRGRQVLRSATALNRLMRLKGERIERVGYRPLPRIQGAISFERVVFRYTPASDPVLLGVNLQIKAGEFLAVLGANGCGKSTLFKLLLRMYEPQGGTVLIDGTDIRQLDVRQLRQQVNYVPQHPKLFKGTLAQNLRLGNPLATDADLDQVLSDSGIAAAIAALPEGLATRVGDQHSASIPSGLVRNLCLARAFLANSSVVLLDEPATALDSEHDARLMHQLERLRGRATVIMVSHRPSHIRLADRAILLKDGVIRVAGPPQEAISAMFGSLSS